MKISEEDIKKMCTIGIYKSGIDYFKEGRVHIRVRAKDSVVASVDSDRLYNVHIGFSEDGKISETFCTCPYYQTMGSNCKHIVATLEARRRELSSGESICDDNDRVAKELCRNFEEAEKQRIEAGFILRMTSDEHRRLKYSVSVTLGDSDVPIAGCESFIDAYMGNGEYKLSKHKTFSREKYDFGETEKEIFAVLFEAYQNKCASQSVHTPTLTSTEVGALTVKRLMPLSKKCNCRFVLDGMQLQNVMFIKDAPDVLLDVTATDDNINISVPQSGYALVPDGSWFLYEGDIYETDEEWQSWFMPIYNALSVESRTQIDFRGANSIAFAANVLPRLKGKRGVVLSGVENVVVDDKPDFDVYFDRTEDGISAVVTATYGKIPVRLPEKGENLDKIVVRDYAGERYILSFFENFSEEAQVLYLLEDGEIFEFLNEKLPKIKALAQVHSSGGFDKLLIDEPPKLSQRVTYDEKIDLLEMGFEADITPSDVVGIINAIRHKKAFFKMKSGEFLPISDELYDFEILDNLDFSYNDVREGKKTVNKYNLLYLSGLFESGKISADSGFDALVLKIRKIRADIPERMEKILRDYQKTGVHWMKQLSELGFGGILADDMGLGKTLEVIAFVMSEKKEKPTLCVTPSALTYNWLAEINKFAPEARVKIIDGTKEERISLLSDISEYDFIITSYPLLRRDIQEYSGLEFSYCFIDEAQHIKNPKTLSAKAVKKINAEICFAVSGTPVENSLGELWSIFDFILPGHLSGRQQFTLRYEKPIRQGETGAADALRSKIKPFILRRMKYDVLKELPDKIENTYFAEPAPSQKKMYAAFLAAARREARELLEFGDRIRILSLLMRLRQICCHPGLIDEDYDAESGKLTLLEELVESGMESGRRILIFSQFTSMLDIIRKRMEKKGIPCFYLDGSTPSKVRAELADRFNGGEGRVFLVSLKAGGTGLNLTGADMVIHYDPWWNPAVVNQATDRAHRIGQTKAVHVIKLATKGTIEEQILKLQAKKQDLAEDMIRENNAMLSNLSKEEILELFK